MKLFAACRRARALVWMCVLLAVPGCHKSAVQHTIDPAHAPHPVRFLLTFDDGPSLLRPYNPTAAILDQLAANAVQPQIKAVFFVQTRAPSAGGSLYGQELLRRIHDAGHVLALHSGTARGHKSHRYLPPAELDRSLADGIADIRALSGQDPTLVRPPYWSFDARTLAAYRAHGLEMLLTDMSAHDGKIWGWHISLRRRTHFCTKLAEVRHSIEENRLPVVDGVIPVVVTFHDTNDFTASHMAEYLEILVQESNRVGLPLAPDPFYHDGPTIQRVARLRAEIGVFGAAPATFHAPECTS